MGPLIWGRTLPKAPSPVCEDGEDYCEHVHNYPAELIEEAMKIFQEKTETAKEMFEKTSEVIPPPRQRRSVSPNNTSPVCATNTYHVGPRAARSEDGQMYFVVNGVEALPFTQLVLTTHCVGQSEMCRAGGGVCSQGYSYYRLAALGEEGIVTHNFVFPTHCLCYRPHDWWLSL